MSESSSEPGNDSYELDPHSERLIEGLVVEFEQALRAKAAPSVEEFLDRCPPPHRFALFKRLASLNGFDNSMTGGAATGAASNTAEFVDYQLKLSGSNLSLGGETAQPPGGSSPTRLSASGFGSGEFFAGESERFEVLGKIGTGGMGSVWKALDKRMNRVVAVKFSKRIGSGGEGKARFLREARAAAKLQHPGIVTVHEVGEHDGVPFIVSDFVEGIDLAEWMRSNQCPPELAAQMCAQMADALQHAHDRGVIHRDFKPHNVLRDSAGTLKLTDFGLAKVLEEETLTSSDNQIMGTLPYMSPEQARGQSQLVSHSTDIYSLGVLLYELLAGQRPFRGEPTTVLRGILSETPTRPSSLTGLVPRDLETICLKALEKSPEKRYAAAADMAADLRLYLDRRPIVARPVTFQERVLRWARRHPAITSALGMAALAAVAVGLVVGLALENQTLRGYRRVSLTTDPPGAEVVFVRLDDATWAPDPQAVTRANSPWWGGSAGEVRADLRPGDYLVVAALPDGRFHEVHRHVPTPSEALPFAASSFLFSRETEDPSISLHALQIPGLDATEGMVRVSIDPAALAENPTLPEAIWVDPYEVPPKNAPDRPYLGQVPPGGDPPLPGEGNHMFLAMRRLEDWGKRLPTAEEFKLVARSLSQSDPQETKVHALLSGAAEWTASLVGLKKQAAIVVGGESDAEVVGTKADPTARTLIPIDELGGFGGGPNLGFRGYRSAAPRFLAPVAKKAPTSTER